MDTATVQSQYICGRCDLNCPTKFQLLRHMITSHRSLQQTTQKPKFNYECPTCGNEYATLLQFHRHLLVHQQRQLLQCPNCPTILCSRKGLTRHSLTKHGIDHTRENKNYECDDCGGMFTSLLSLTLHSAAHKPPQFSCNKCDRKFFSLSGVVAHTRLGHLSEKLKFPLNTREVSCEKCPKKFQSAATLQTHLNNIHLPKDHKCPHCYKEFSVVIHLKNHLLKAHSIRVDTDVSCNICHKICKGQSGLLKHSRFHGSPTILCDQCPQTFYTPLLLGIHTKQVHNVRFAIPRKAITKEINYTCAVCCKPFGLKKSSLRLHLRIHYSKGQVCPVCQKLFNSEQSFSNHMRQNHPDSRETLECRFCCKKFLSQASFQEHMIYHRKPTLACPDCPLLFYNKSSVRFHSKSHNSEAKSSGKGYPKSNKIFACAICLRQYHLWFRLRDHLRDTHNPTTFGCSKCDFQCYLREGITRHLRNFHIC